MATGTTPSTASDPLYDVTAPDIQGLLGAVLGKEVKSQTDSTQNTTGSTVSDTSNTQNQNTTQQNTTTNTGNQRTTGTVGHVSDTTQTGRTATVGNADTAALKETYARQAGGITPEMLDAIFQQGAKAAPGMVVANSNALGARAGNNTPVAAALQQLHLDLTAKAADINRQLLQDAGNTAGKIADVTRSSTSDTSQSANTTGEDVQNLLTSTDSKSIADQISNTLNQTNGHATASQTQAIQAAEKKKQQTTINTSVAKTLLGAFVGGVALDQLFRQAVSHGFFGTLTDLGKQLMQAGASPDKVNAELQSQGYPPIDPATLEPPTVDASVFPPFDYPPVDTNIDYPPPSDATDPTWLDPSDFPNGADGGFVRGMADGGLSFLPIPDLIRKPQPQMASGNPDADLNGLLNALLGGKESRQSARTSSDAGPGIESSNAGPGPASDRDGSNPGSNPGNSSGSNPGSNSGGKGGKGGTDAKGKSNEGPTVAGVVTGMVTSVATAALSKMGLVGLIAAGIVNEVSKRSRAAAQAEDENDVPEPTPKDFVGPINEVVGPINDFMGPMNDVPGPTNDAAPLGPNNDAAAQGDEGNDGGGNTDSGGGEGGGDYADGGDVEEGESQAAESSEPANEDIDEDHDFLLNALGISRATGGGSLTFSPQAVKMLHRAITHQPGAPGMANGGVMRKPKGYNQGGEIKGPGTGISDSIPAVTTGGRPLRVADGEYIIPADVVQKFGVDAFDQLVNQHHIPADMQRAITG